MASLWVNREENIVNLNMNMNDMLFYQNAQWRLYGHVRGIIKFYHRVNVITPKNVPGPHLLPWFIFTKSPLQVWHMRLVIHYRVFIVPTHNNKSVIIICFICFYIRVGASYGNGYSMKHTRYKYPGDVSKTWPIRLQSWNSVISQSNIPPYHLWHIIGLGNGLPLFVAQPLPEPLMTWWLLVN